MNLNLYTWHINRQLSFCPKHFILVKTEITEESRSWVLEHLTGRFYIGSFAEAEDDFLSTMYDYPAFEDPQEAVLYQLKWS